MKMTPLNIGILIVAISAGVIIGGRYPLFALLLIVPLVIFIVTVLMRNKSGAMADPGKTADAKSLEVAEGKARIYVMRKGFVGGQQGMNITIGAALASQIRTGHFLMAEVDPGEHLVTAGMSSGTESANSDHTVTLGPGEVALLDAKVNMGMVQVRPDFVEIRDKAQISQMIVDLKLVEWKAEG